jgi:hypothetical protein
VKEVPTVLNQTLNVAAAPVGAVFTGACTPWTSLSVARVNPVRTQNPVQVGGATTTRSALLWPLPAVAARLASMTATELPTAFGNRKQTVHKTRINAGGYGTMGPHPEREPA